MVKRNQIRQDAADNVPAVLSDEEQMLLKLSQKNTKFEQSELTIPRLKVLQQLSPEVQEGGNQYVPGAKAGMFYNTASTKLTPGQEGMTIVVVGHTKSTIEWMSNNPGSGMVKNWGVDEGWKALCEPTQREALNPMTKEGHYIDKRRSFLIINVNAKTGEMDPSFFDLRSTGNRVAKQLSDMLVQARYRMSNGQIITPPFYYFVYKMTLELVRNQQGQSWWLPKVSKYNNENNEHVKTTDLPKGNEIFKEAMTLQEHFLEGGITQSDYEAPQGDDLGNDRVTF